MRNQSPDVLCTNPSVGGLISTVAMQAANHQDPITATEVNTRLLGVLNNYESKICPPMLSRWPEHINSLINCRLDTFRTTGGCCVSTISTNDEHTRPDALKKGVNFSVLETCMILVAFRKQILPVGNISTLSSWS